MLVGEIKVLLPIVKCNIMLAGTNMIAQIARFLAECLFLEAWLNRVPPSQTTCIPARHDTMKDIRP